MTINTFVKDDVYKKIVQNVPIATVDVLLFSKDLKKVLLFLRNNAPAMGQYYSLGGRLFKGEDFVSCTKRKLKEEAGIKASGENLIFIGIQNEIFSNCFFSDKIPSHFVNVYYTLIYHEEMDIVLDSQHRDYRWFDVSDLSLNDYMQIKIEKSLEVMNKNESRF